MNADEKTRAAIAALANALQVAVPVAARLRQRLDAQAQDANALETALALAMQAMRQLQPGRGA
jgi:hypothetical protein